MLVKKVYAACDPSQGSINLSDCLELSDGQKVSDVYDKPATVVNLIVQNLFVLAGILMFVFIIVAGYKYIQDDTKGKDEAKSIMTGLIAGFIVMFAAYWIVQIIEQLTGTQILL